MSKKLMESIGYAFKKPYLLDSALTHASYQNCNQASNEKMEFLGDRVLGLVMADILYQHRDTYTEGAMAVMFNYLVCRDTCASVANHYKLAEYVRVGPSERRGHMKKAILADACEALIGALYLDAGYTATQKFVQAMWQEPLTHVLTHDLPIDPKTLLQQWAQKRGLPLPVYTIAQRVGKAHEPIFTVAVHVGDTQVQAHGLSKKEAERKAAKLFLEQIPCPK